MCQDYIDPDPLYLGNTRFTPGTITIKQTVMSRRKRRQDIKRRWTEVFAVRLPWNETRDKAIKLWLDEQTQDTAVEWECHAGSDNSRWYFNDSGFLFYFMCKWGEGSKGGRRHGRNL